MRIVRDTQFWNHLTELVRSHPIVIDRPKGTTHPRYPSFYYPLDYGYLDGTSGGDGQAIDVGCAYQTAGGLRWLP